MLAWRSSRELSQRSRVNFEYAWLHTMSKAFTKEADSQDDGDDGAATLSGLALSAKNYMTPHGHRRLLDELRWLVNDERPQVTSVVSWAAKNGDRSENGDYLYGKKRLREIDRRIRYLTKRIENAEVVNPATRESTDQIFFAATVNYRDADGESKSISIVGVDEAEVARGLVSWISPLARAFIKAREGDCITFNTPGGTQQLEIAEVRYCEIPMAPFRPIEGLWKPNQAKGA
jgi:transcription elongation factor GreB